MPNTSEFVRPAEPHLCHGLRLHPLSLATPPPLPPSNAATTTAAAIFTSSFGHGRLHRRPFYLCIHSHTLHPSRASKPLQNPNSFFLKIRPSGNVGGGGGIRGGGGSGGNGNDSTWDSFFNFDKNPLFFSTFCCKFSDENGFFDSIKDNLSPLFQFFLLISAFLNFHCFVASIAGAKTHGDISSRNENETEGQVVCEIRGGKKIELIPDYNRDEFVVPKTILTFLWRRGSSKQKLKLSIGSLWMQCRELFMT